MSVLLLALAIAAKARLGGMRCEWTATTWAEVCTDKVPLASLCDQLDCDQLAWLMSSLAGFSL